jgi:signal recognition particle GTPase
MMVTKVNKLTVDQLKALINELIDEKLEQILSDPDEGLVVREEIITKLKAQKSSRKKRIPMEQVAREFGLNLK